MLENYREFSIRVEIRDIFDHFFRAGGNRRRHCVVINHLRLGPNRRLMLEGLGPKGFTNVCVGFY